MKFGGFNVTNSEELKTLEHAVFDEFKGNKSIAVRYATLSHLFKLVLYIPYKN